MPMPASYTTVSDVLGRYPPLGSVSAVTSAHIAEAIGAEQAMIDAKLSRMFAVPFAPVPPIIQSIAADMATYRLLTTRAMLPERRAEGFADPFKHSYDMLCMLASGSADLVSGSGTIIAIERGEHDIWTNIGTNTPVFIGQEFDLVYPPETFY